MSPDLATIRARLSDRRAQLLAHVASLEADLGQPMEADFAEQAVEREDDEALDRLSRVELAEIGQIDRAIERIDQGAYGVCIECGEPIAPARLAALPEAAMCMECATGR
ncbi:RNA polymerase-binding protein DksA [Sphingobium fontiphilum]|uniref:RNA polymerase-binding protein DksA n=1 Tax=Sphingobium fontiphilum TaxID=944425 RepID=A0A7W6DDR0_9SPHN|nr:RNA polymerase-binding protein DksA [Sphingobium fontiphilum]